ncbi:hypothetical protein B0H34DRAFT_1139 [Crassisporium funariophilum]|nr:hypothetical protein B0H34DRAFT_1139 [Crassisporium funariophilum]
MNNLDSGAFVVSSSKPPRTRQVSGHGIVQEKKKFEYVQLFHVLHSLTSFLLSEQPSTCNYSPRSASFSRAAFFVASSRPLGPPSSPKSSAFKRRVPRDSIAFMKISTRNLHPRNPRDANDYQTKSPARCSSHARAVSHVTTAPSDCTNLPGSDFELLAKFEMRSSKKTRSKKPSSSIQGGKIKDNSATRLDDTSFLVLNNADVVSTSDSATNKDMVDVRHPQTATSIQGKGNKCCPRRAPLCLRISSHRPRSRGSHGSLIGLPKVDLSSPVSPIFPRIASQKEQLRRRLLKLTRTLGEGIPIEMVKPPTPPSSARRDPPILLVPSVSEPGPHTPLELTLPTPSTSTSHVYGPKFLRDPRSRRTVDQGKVGSRTNEVTIEQPHFHKTAQNFRGLRIVINDREISSDDDHEGRRENQWPRSPFRNLVETDRLAPPGVNSVVIKSRNSTSRKERRQGWSGEWNQPDIQDVIHKLRIMRL